MDKYSPTDPGVMADPYLHYARLREGPSAIYIPVDDLWVVSRFAEVDDALRRPSQFSSAAHWALFTGTLSARDRPRPDVVDHAARQPKNLIAVDPPVHRDLRKLAASMFTPRSVAGYEHVIGEICSGLVDEMLALASPSEPVDIVTKMFHPLPVRVIARILGVPDERLPDFARWSDILIFRQSGVEDADKAEVSELIAFFHELLERRRREPGGDLIDLLITENARSTSGFTDKDLLNFFTLLLVAGHETTTGLLGNLLTALIMDPPQMRSAWDGGDSADIVDEALRFDAPAQAIPRITLADVEVGDTLVPRHSILLLLAGSANRDERRWTNAGRFDAARPRKSHIAFGTGIHACLGGALARIEARIALETLRGRVGSIEAGGDSVRAVTPTLRGFGSIPVLLSPR